MKHGYCKERGHARTGKVLAAAMLLGWVLACADDPAPKKTLDLHADITFNGTQFLITNQSDTPWSGVEIDLNYETFSSGFTAKLGALAPHQTATIGAMQLARSDGTRFNPFNMKPLKMSVKAVLPDGNVGVYFGSW